MAKSKKTTSKKAVAPKAKPVAKKTAKPAAKPVAKAKSVAKPAAKAKKVAAKPIAKAKAKPTAKPVAKKAVKPAVKAAAKKAAKPAVKSKAKPVAKKIAKPAPKKAAKPVAKKAIKPSPKKAAKPMPKAAPKKVAKPIAKKAAKPAPKKAVAPSPKKAIKPAAKQAPKPVVAAKQPVRKPEPKPIAPARQEAPKVEAMTPVVDKMMEKKPLLKKPLGKKSSKPVETYEGKRVVRSEMPAKALITIQKPEEEAHMDTPHYEYPSLRYSDAELKEFKELIEIKLASQREELKNLKDSLGSHQESQEGNKSWNMEEGSDTSEMEYLMNQIARLNKFIRDLEMALVRIENKTYGICRATGKLIDKNRLRVVPHATLSMEAKMSRKTDDIPNTSQTPAAHMGSEGEGFGSED